MVDLVGGEPSAAQAYPSALEDGGDAVAVEFVLLGQILDGGSGLVVGDDASELACAELPDGLGEWVPFRADRILGGWEFDDQPL